MCFQLQPFSRLISSSFSVRSDRFMCRLPFTPVVPGIPVFLALTYEDVDGRDPSTPEASTGFECRSAEALAKAGKPDHDVCFDSSDTAAIISSGLPIRTTGTLRGS